ncbi:MAG: ribose-phosphate diphosphokinase [Candidatus Aenigmarchaeota archaeon]|nr:ribose-phosphate diphosphokinase [Candidatus Aenigmarchaeota archaeon]
MIVLGRDLFSRKLAEELKAEFVEVFHKKFPDGEYYFRISEPDKLKGRKAFVVVRRTMNNLDQNGMIIESLLLADKIKGLEAEKSCLVLPYMPYARQDKEFLKGEVVSVKTLRDMLTEKYDLVLNVTSHDLRKEGWINEKAYNIDATDSIIEFFRKMNFKDPIVIAPDMTASENVERLAKAIGGNTLAVEKKRDYNTGHITSNITKLPNFSGQELIIFDDICSTGGTLYKAIGLTKKAKARKIIAVVIHLLDVYNEKFGKNSVELIENSADEFHATDTIETPLSDISVIGQIGDFLKKNF